MSNPSSFSSPSLRWLLIVAALALGATLAWRPLALPDEGRYISVAAGMWHSGDWLVPRLDGLPFFHKPPLFYWVAGALYGLTGGTPWMARGASWLGAMLGIAAVAWLVFTVRGSDRHDRLAGWAVVALAAQPLWYIGAQFANLDMLVAGCITVAICSLAVHEFEPKKRGARWLGFLFIGLGVLAKGLIGVVLPLAVLGLWMAWERRFSGWLRLAWVPGWALALAVALPWFFAVDARHPGFFHYFFVVQHFQRYTATGFNNMMPAWFFPAVVAVTALPWSVLCIARLIGVARRGKALLAPAADRTASLERLGVAWLIVITLFFSLPASKLVGYILPAVPALALLAALAADRFTQRTDGWRRLPHLLGALGLALSVGATGIVANFDRKTNAPIAQRLRAQWQPGDALVFEGAFFYDLGLLLGRPDDVPVLLDWDNPHATRSDGWERELSDAAKFDPARGRSIMRTPDQWPAMRCAAPRTWVVSVEPERARMTALLGTPPGIVVADKADLYLVTRPADCPR